MLLRQKWLMGLCNALAVGFDYMVHLLCDFCMDALIDHWDDACKMKALQGLHGHVYDLMVSRAEWRLHGGHITKQLPVHTSA